jgi:hypothetical protein
MLNERERQLKLARRRGVRHLAVPGHFAAAPKSDAPSWDHSSVHRSKSEQRLSETDNENLTNGADQLTRTLESKLERPTIRDDERVNTQQE